MPGSAGTPTATPTTSPTNPATRPPTTYPLMTRRAAATRAHCPPSSTSSSQSAPCSAGLPLLAQAGAWDLLDRDETRTIVNAAAEHPRTRWCVTLTAPDGTAVAHACARGPRPALLDDLQPQPPPAQIAELLGRLNLTFTPIAKNSCDHADTEAHYTPSRKLRHLIRARSGHLRRPRLRGPGTQHRLGSHHRGPTVPPARATSPPGAEPTTAPSKHRTGRQNSPHRGSPAGPFLPAAPTPPRQPGTTPRCQPRTGPARHAGDRPGEIEGPRAPAQRPHGRTA